MHMEVQICIKLLSTPKAFCNNLMILDGNWLLKQIDKIIKVDNRQLTLRSLTCYSTCISIPFVRILSVDNIFNFFLLKKVHLSHITDTNNRQTATTVKVEFGKDLSKRKQVMDTL